ncbi:MAG: LysR family transcriptional regulator [Proteobacteria bacterium]|nr:LysR family transcriptional regulator [Pseudomonadota bacterium]
MPDALPPLNALKAFEAAARHGGFASAAQELGVSPAAVSQLVQKLERHLGKTLFTRFNNRILLTDAGKAIFAGVTPALNEIAETVRRVSRGNARRKVVLSALPSVAECWLAPALSRFLVAHPKIRVDLRVEDDPAEASSEADLRITYGRAPDPERVQAELIRDSVFPLCAPGFMNSHQGRRAFTAALGPHLIHTSWGASYGSNPTWHDWYHAFAPHEKIDMAVGHQVNASRLALQLARDGVGMALAHRWLAADDLAAGRLIVASEKTLPLGQSYFIGWPPSRARQTDVMLLKDWLLLNVQPPTTGQSPRP